MASYTTDTPPQQTLYARNVHEKLSKDELKKSLYTMFSQFGRILDVVVMKTYRLRGQAWIVFADVAASTNARNAMQGFPFYDKPLVLEYAKSKSDAVAKEEGNFDTSAKAGRKKKNAAAREAFQKRQKTTVQAPAAAGIPAAAKGDGMGGVVPHNILFVQNLPPDASASMINMLFTQFLGFREVRLVDARPGIAFVEYESEPQATQAMSGLQNFQVLNKGVTMCNSLVDRAQHLLDPGSPDAMRLVWTLLVLYCTMAVPALAWTIFALRKLLKRDSLAKVVPDGPSRGAQPDSEVEAEPLSAEQAMRLIKWRRSVYPKDFTGELVDRATLEQVLEAANWAPTHGKTEPWRFTVLSPEGLDQLIAVSLSVMERVLTPELFAMKKKKLESKMKLFQKATFIALNVKRQAKPDKLMPEWEEIAATSCAVQNLQLAAQPFGVVGYWSSWQPFEVCNDPEFKQFLGINADDIQIGFFLAGRASPSTLAAYRPPRRGPIGDKIIWK